jgi:hypothetical protein
MIVISLEIVIIDFVVWVKHCWMILQMSLVWWWQCNTCSFFVITVCILLQLTWSLKYNSPSYMRVVLFNIFYLYEIGLMIFDWWCVHTFLFMQHQLHKKCYHYVRVLAPQSKFVSMSRLFWKCRIYNIPVCKHIFHYRYYDDLQFHLYKILQGTKILKILLHVPHLWCNWSEVLLYTFHILLRNKFWRGSILGSWANVHVS